MACRIRASLGASRCSVAAVRRAGRPAWRAGRMVRPAQGRTDLSQHRRRTAGKRRPRRSVRAFLLTTIVSAIFVVASAEYAIGEFAPKANPLADALSSIQTSRQGLRLEHQRQHMIRMTAATKSFKLVGKVKVAKVPPPPTPPAGTANPPPVNVPLPSPGTSQAIAYQLLPQFGFNAKQQYPCLDQLW